MLSFLNSGANRIKITTVRYSSSASSCKERPQFQMQMDQAQRNCNFIHTIIAHSQLIKKEALKIVSFSHFQFAPLRVICHVLKREQFPVCWQTEILEVLHRF